MAETAESATAGVLALVGDNDLRWMERDGDGDRCLGVILVYGVDVAGVRA